MSARLSIVAAVILVFSFSGILFADTISIPGNSTVSIGFNATTYGQTFRVPGSSLNENILTQFSFTFQGVGQYHAFIYEWNGNITAFTSNPVGSALFDSGPLVAPGSLTQIFFNAPGIALDPTKGYVAFIGAPSLLGFVFADNISSPFEGLLTRSDNPVFTTLNSWQGLPNLDLAFTANLAAPSVPEPSALLTLLSGISLLALSSWRRGHSF